MDLKFKRPDGKYNVYKQDETLIVDKSWFDYISLKGVSRAEITSCGKLIVDYEFTKTSKRVVYTNIHGTWGFPTTIQ